MPLAIDYHIAPFVFRKEFYSQPTGHIGYMTSIHCRVLHWALIRFPYVVCYAWHTPYQSVHLTLCALHEMVYLINACMCVMVVVIYCNWYFFYYLLLQGEEHPSGELLSFCADSTTEDLGKSKADASTAPSETLDRSEQDEGNVDENEEVHAVTSSANDSGKLVVGHTWRIPKYMYGELVVAGIQLPTEMKRQFAFTASKRFLLIYSTTLHITLQCTCCEDSVWCQLKLADDAVLCVHRWVNLCMWTLYSRTLNGTCTFNDVLELKLCTDVHDFRTPEFTL